MQSVLFRQLREHYQKRDRLRLIVDYRQKFLDSLVRGDEKEAKQAEAHYEQAKAQTDRASVMDWMAGTGIILLLGFEHGGQESEALRLLIQRPGLLKIRKRLLEGAERHAAVHFDQLMG